MFYFTLCISEGERLLVHRYVTARYNFSIKYNTCFNHNTVLRMLFRDIIPNRDSYIMQGDLVHFIIFNMVKIFSFSFH
jgi:hypothetical protein